jgi:hypothetical protein
MFLVSLRFAPESAVGFERIGAFYSARRQNGVGMKVEIQFDLYICFCRHPFYKYRMKFPPGCRRDSARKSESLKGMTFIPQK